MGSGQGRTSVARADVSRRSTWEAGTAAGGEAEGWVWSRTDRSEERRLGSRAPRAVNDAAKEWVPVCASQGMTSEDGKERNARNGI